MILPDVNVLLYAFRRDKPTHSRYHDWLDATLNGESAYAMSPQVLSSVIRISTHHRIFAHPSQLEEALAFSRVCMEQPHCQIVEPGPRHWAIFADLCRRTRASGNLVQDAWFAALAIENACEWITTDRDFSRFPGLRWRPPF
jgi:uncharacterized protein